MFSYLRLFQNFSFGVALLRKAGNLKFKGKNGL
jgi:hypothetical protein